MDDRDTRQIEVEEETVPEPEKRRAVVGGAERWCRLAALVESLDGYDLLESDPMDVPGAKPFAAAVLREIRSVEHAVSAAREALGSMEFSFDGLPDDAAVEREAGLDLFDSAEQGLDGLRESVLKWLKKFGHSRLVELDGASMKCLQSLAKTAPVHCCWAARNVDLVVPVAIKHFAALPEAHELIIDAEERRLKRLENRLYRGEETEPDADGEETEPDADGDETGTFAATISLSEFDGQSDEVVDLAVTREEYATLRREILALGAHYTEQRANALRARSESRGAQENGPTEKALRPGRNDEPSDASVEDAGQENKAVAVI